MSLFNSQVVMAIITSAGATGLVSGLVSYFKDRKKDAATAKLTDVQALQQQVALMEQVTRFLREENERLQADYNESENARRTMRVQLNAVEDELQKVKHNSLATQEHCEQLSKQLKALKASIDQANGGPKPSVKPTTP